MRAGRRGRHRALGPSLSCLLGLAVSCGLAAAASAHEIPPRVESAVTLEQIMADPLWIAATPEQPRWSADGRSILYETARVGEDDTDLWRLDLSSGEAVEIPPSERSAVTPWVDDPSQRATVDGVERIVFARDGDLFVYRAGREGATRQLTRTEATESRPRFFDGGRAVAFERDGQTFVRDLASGLEAQPFALRDGADPDADLDETADADSDESAADEDFFTEVQMRLFESIQDDEARRKARRATDRERRAADAARARPPVYLGEGLERLWAELSPTTEAVMVVASRTSRDEGRKDKMPVWVTEDGFTEIRDLRPKVGTGDGSGAELLLFVDKEDGVERHAIDLSTLPGIDEDPLARPGDDAGQEPAGDETQNDSDDSDDSNEGDAAADTDGTLRAVTVDDLAWSPDGSLAVVSIHSVDNKDRWLVALSPDDPTPRLVERLSDEGWINWRFNDISFLPDGRLLFLSEATDRSQLYLWDPADGSTRRLSADRGVVAGPRWTDDGRHVLYVANTTAAPYRFDLYRVAVDGAARAGSPESVEQITSTGGTIDSFHLSPSGDRVLWRQGEAIRPPELFVQPLRPGADARRLTRSVSDAFASIDWVEPEIVPVPSSHVDRPLWARYYAPRNPERLRGSGGSVPAVVFVHGAGYLHNAHAGWSVYFREMMFHTLLAEQGYAVLDMDYRGSAGYGADWRTAIYGHMGGPELEDLRDGVEWLVAEHGVDAERVGVYGGSYGGFLTLMALFTEPDLFAAGAALRPVTDWAHYNHGYTSNILDTPSTRPEHYRRSSPIEFAEGLEKPLLICAPMLDDNVFFSDTVRLVQRLIELEKEDWELAVYPVEPHSFQRPSSWLDEYRRIFKLFEQTLVPEPAR